MYPGTQFNWIDQSFIQEDTTVTEDTSPIFMAVGSFYKGPESFITVNATNFNELYGEMSFFDHGQNAIQLQNIIDGGGRLFLKRVVASDSTLANLVILAKVKAKQKEVQSTDENGNLLYYTDDTKTETTTTKTAYKVMEKVYLDADGNETTTETDTPVNVANISYEAKSFENISAEEGDFDDAYANFKTEALNLLSISTDDDEESTFPLFIISDNGRGSSSKSIKITPDYNTSRGSGHMFYNFEVLEGSTRTEAFIFTANPNVIYTNTRYGLDSSSSTQVIPLVDESVFAQFAEKVADIGSLEVSDIINQDILFGKTNKGTDIESIDIDSEGLDVQATSGVSLEYGDNGAFGDAPGNPDSGDAYDAWAAAIAKVYSGEVTDEIYDVDEHKICAIIDASFPLSVKKAITDLVSFREDCIFFRDIGIGKYTFSEIKEAKNNLVALFDYDETKYKFCADYATSYQIREPNTQKLVEVTALYDLAGVLPRHFESNANAPLAGTYNGMTLPSAIKGTINFTPINTPKVNQKQAMEDLHINYAIFEGDNCVLQTTYTCQETLSQLSFLNNVIAIQDVMRSVRTACPINRFSLSNGTDLSSYAKSVNNVLDQYSSRFDVLEFEYTANTLLAEQKIFYASIRFAFLNWAQSEIFDLYAINNE